MNKSPTELKNQSVLNFLLSKQFITLTVIGSVFTFSFIASLKADIVDPLFHFILPEENFGFMDVTLRDGESIQLPSPVRLDLKLGNFFKQFLIWIFAISILFLLSKYTQFPDHIKGNPGVAVM